MSFQDFPPYSCHSALLILQASIALYAKPFRLPLKTILGILAMKTLAAGRVFKRTTICEKIIWETETPVIPDYANVKEALYFSWSLPVSVLITGAENKTFLLEKIKLAREFTKLTESEKDQILDKASRAPNIDKVEYYKNVES